MEGFIYILTHDRIPGLVKIGYTNCKVSDRIEEINTATGVPNCYKEFCSFKVVNAVKVESAIHDKLKHYRHSNNKEFFELKPAVAKNMLEK